MTTLHQFPNQHPAPESAPRVIDPAASVLRHWRLGLLAGLLVMAAGIPIAWMKGEPRWRSEGVVFVSPRFLRNLDADSEHELQSNSQYREFVQQQVRTINRFDIVQSALNTAGARGWRKPDETERRATDRLRAALQIAPVPDTYQVTVALEGERPEGLAEIVNAIMESYLQAARTELVFDSEARLRNLEGEKAQLQGAIDGLIEERTRIAQQLGTTVFSAGVITSYDRMLGASSEALALARKERFVAEFGIGSEAPGKKPDAAADAAAFEKALNDAGLNSLKSALNQRKAELLLRINGLGPQHTARIAGEKEIQQIDREIERVTQALRDRLAANTEVLNHARYEQTAQVERNLQEETRNLRSQAEAYSRAYQRSLELGEELERTRKRLSAVEDRISYLHLEGKAPGFVRVFTPALKPDLPVQGGRKKLLLMVLAAALLMAAAVPLGVDYFDPRVMAPAELEAQVGLPVAGWLPLASADAAHVDERAILRTAVSIRRHLDGLRRRALVISALHHGGGSSSVALALAAALGRLGTRTLVIEANPQTPDSRYTGITPRTGLMGLLAERTSIPECIEKASGDLPDRIRTGDGCWEALLPAERLLPIVDTLLQDYDLALIDAAPLPDSLPTEEMVRLLGAILLVVDSQRDGKTAIKACMQKLQRLSPQAFGAVLNKVNNPPVIPFWTKKNDSPTVLAA